LKYAGRVKGYYIVVDACGLWEWFTFKYDVYNGGKVKG